MSSLLMIALSSVYVKPIKQIIRENKDRKVNKKKKKKKKILA